MFTVLNNQQETIQKFQAIIWDYYHKNKRDFVWRATTDPYHIVVSEIMLQQTQTARVKEKYTPFILAFPDFQTLATAALRDILTLWQGLGYNRRAIALQRIAQLIIQDHNGSLPEDQTVLISFPGIGPNTAGSICAFAFNKPTVFIETNIRTVFIEHFFPQHINTTDKQLLPLIVESIDHTNPREWYYALMDYGVMLKKTRPNPSRKSAHHTQQSKFEGSDRQVRGMVLKLLTHYSILSYDDLYQMIPREKHRIDKAIISLEVENFIVKNKNLFSIL